MSPSVVLLAVDANGSGAVAGRMQGLQAGLRRRGWTVTLADIGPLPTSIGDRILNGLPPKARHFIESSGVEGDYRPRAGRVARRRLRRFDTDVVVVSVPPFSLLQAALALPSHVHLVLDYRDPWNAQEAPPVLAQLTRPIERRAIKRASAITYAGDPVLREHLTMRLDAPQHKVRAVPNGHDPQDLRHLQRQAQVEQPRPLQLLFVGFWYGRNGPAQLPQALAALGPAAVELTVIGGISPPLLRQISRIVGRPPNQIGPLSRKEMYRHLANADLAVVVLDESSAVESRVPAKMYDYLAVGTPVLAVCPPQAALLRLPEAQRFHHIHHQDLDGLIDFLRRCSEDRSMLLPGPLGGGPTRDEAAAIMHEVLNNVIDRPAPVPP